MSTEHKVAVITGASQGIGAGLVRGFLDAAIASSPTRGRSSRMRGRRCWPSRATSPTRRSPTG